MKAGNFGKGDKLTPIQAARMSGALAVFKAKEQAVRDGVPLDRVRALTWRATWEDKDGQKWHLTAEPDRVGGLDPRPCPGHCDDCQ